MNIKELQELGIEELKKNDIDEPVLKTRLLLSFILNKKKEYLIINYNEEIDKKIEKKFLNGISKLKEKIPIEHITKNKEFMKLNFYVDENVLIPRSDTEILVEEVIKRCNSGKILDLCTGSGIVAVSLAKYIKESMVYASDISKEALIIARKNAKQNGVNVKFIESNLFDNIKEKNFDIIVSNPPYIETDTIKTLQDEVKKEPIIALDGGKTGLDFYQKIISKAHDYLKKDGLLVLEIGFNQAKNVVSLLQEHEFKYIEVIKDLAGHDRVIISVN